MSKKQPINVDAILKEMSATRDEVAIELLQNSQEPLILRDDDEVSLEELIYELEEDENIRFNFSL